MFRFVFFLGGCGVSMSAFGDDWYTLYRTEVDGKENCWMCMIYILINRNHNIEIIIFTSHNICTYMIMIMCMYIEAYKTYKTDKTKGNIIINIPATRDVIVKHV